MQTNNSKELLIDFMERYCAAFRPGNAAEIPAYYQCPFTLTQNAKSQIVAHEQDLNIFFKALLDVLAERRFSRSKLDRMDCIAVAKDTFFVSAAFSRYRDDGVVLEQVGATYTVVCVEGQFKIAAIVAHDADAMVTFATRS